MTRAIYIGQKWTTVLQPSILILWPQSLSNCGFMDCTSEAALQNLNVSDTRTRDLKIEILLTIHKLLEVFHQIFQASN